MVRSMCKVSLTMAAAILCVSLAACGGGGGSPVAANDAGVTATGGLNANPGTGSSGGDTGSAPFAAMVTIAPPAGATLAGNVQLEVRGSAIGNAELLPADGYAPVLGRFSVATDRTMAALDFDTRSLPNGVLLARISAFDQPAGSTGTTEIVAMPARRWTLANSPEPVVTQIPPASLMPEVHISSLALPYVDPAPLAAMMQLDDAAYEAMLQNEWPRVEAEMLRYIPAHVVLYPPTPNGFSGPWYSCLDFHTRLACREAMNSMIGLMRSKQT